MPSDIPDLDDWLSQPGKKSRECGTCRTCPEEVLELIRKFHAAHVAGTTKRSRADFYAEQLKPRDYPFSRNAFYSHIRRCLEGKE